MPIDEFLLADFHKGYRCYDPRNKKLHVTLDVSFCENEPYYTGGVLRSSLQGLNLSEELEQNSRDIGVSRDPVEFLELEVMQEKIEYACATTHHLSARHKDSNFAKFI